jgi:ankyrin repeat protein
MIQYLIEKQADLNIKNNSGSSPLHEAARSGSLAAMDLLLTAGANPNTQDVQGNSPLHIAIPERVHQEAVETLLSYRADPNIKDEHGDSPLHIIITLKRSVQALETLLAGGADVNVHNMDGKTPLYLAVETDQPQYIPPLLQRRSDIFAEDNSGRTPFNLALQGKPNALPLLITKETVLQSDNVGNTVLHQAIKGKGTTDTVGNIIDMGAVVNSRNNEGDTALHIAVRLNEEANGRFLLDRGADVFALNARREPPLDLAFHSPGGIREWILANPTNAKDSQGNTVLHYAARWALDAYIPLILMDGKIPLETVNSAGETPLFEAIKSNSPSTVQILIRSGALLTSRDKMGNAPLHVAVQHDAGAVIDILIGSKAELSPHALNGNTPLHDAVIGLYDPSQNPALRTNAMAAVLISNRAELEARDGDGNTPLMRAVLAGLRVTTTQLADAGADLNTRNVRGDSPLHVAVSIERSDLITTLLDRGALLSARNAQNQTPLQLAFTAAQARMTYPLLAGTRIHMTDDEGRSALHVAIQSDASPEIIKTIMELGCRLSVTDSEGRTPLRLAVDRLPRGNIAQDPNQMAPYQDTIAIVRLFTAAGANIYTAAADSLTPAEIVLTKGQTAVNALFDASRINVRDSTGNTILHYAARNSGRDIVDLLVQLGADKSLRNISNETPAEVARRWNNQAAEIVLR